MTPIFEQLATEWLGSDRGAVVLDLEQYREKRQQASKDATTALTLLAMATTSKTVEGVVVEKSAIRTSRERRKVRWWHVVYAIWQDYKEQVRRVFSGEEF